MKEQTYISLLAILVGGIVGIAASWLFPESNIVIPITLGLAAAYSLFLALRQRRKGGATD